MFTAVILAAGLRAVNAHEVFVAHALEVETNPVAPPSAVVRAPLNVARLAGVICLARASAILSANAVSAAHVRARLRFARGSRPSVATETLPVQTVAVTVTVFGACNVPAAIIRRPSPPLVAFAHDSIFYCFIIVGHGRVGLVAHRGIDHIYHAVPVAGA